MTQRKRSLDVNQIFAYRLRDARMSKGWRQQDLADAMKKIGHPVNRATISKIEKGARGVGGGHGREPIRCSETSPRPVSLGVAIAFAAALDVAPVHLFLPITDEDDVLLAPEVRVDPGTAYEWARGDHPLGEDDRFYRFQGPRQRAKAATLADLEEMGILQVTLEPKATSKSKRTRRRGKQ